MSYEATRIITKSLVDDYNCQIVDEPILTYTDKTCVAKADLENIPEETVSYMPLYIILDKTIETDDTWMTQWRDGTVRMDASEGPFNINISSVYEDLYIPEWRISYDKDNKEFIYKKAYVADNDNDKSWFTSTVKTAMGNVGDDIYAFVVGLPWSISLDDSGAHNNYIDSIFLNLNTHKFDAQTDRKAVWFSGSDISPELSTISCQFYVIMDPDNGDYYKVYNDSVQKIIYVELNESDDSWIHVGDSLMYSDYSHGFAKAPNYNDKTQQICDLSGNELYEALSKSSQKYIKITIHKGSANLQKTDDYNNSKYFIFN